MRGVRLFLVAVLTLSVLGLSAPPGAADPTSREVEVAVTGTALGQHGNQKPKCEGSAPTHFRCHMTWTIDGNFGIRQVWANTFWGWTIIRWETPTGYGQSTCYKAPDPSSSPSCEDEEGGWFEVGQTLVITAWTVGLGYWLVEVT